MFKAQLLAGATAAALLVPGAAEAAELSLKRVMLSSGGVGYFEYEAAVTGNEVLELDVRLDQVDDVMKSLVIYDDTGSVGEVSLPGRQPLRDTFRDLPFPQEALYSPAALLDSLRGAEVEVTGSRKLKGRILSVVTETTTLKDGGTIERTRVSLLSEAGVAQFLLEEADSLRFTDPALEAAVNKALVAMAEHGERDRRTLKLTARGTGERKVRVAYVVEAPLWKTSYRLTLPADPTAITGNLQGWAVLENMSGDDWEEVELTLVSGNPVTFRQALYDTYYVYRPEVPVEVLGRVLPPVDEEKALLQDGYAKEDQDRSRAYEQEAPAAAPSGGAYAESAPAPTTAADIAAAGASEATTQVVFTFDQPVTVTSGGSLIVPFISRDVPAERLAYYQPDAYATHPLATVELENDGETGLPPGVLTLYEQAAGGPSYVGDARLGVLPAGESRLLSFAVDQKVAVTELSRTEQTVTGVKIVSGVMTLDSRELYRRSYEIQGAAKEPRVVLLEHPRWSGWTLIEPEEEQLEVTPGTYRALIAVNAGEIKTFAFGLQRPVVQTIHLSNLDDRTLEFYLTAEFIPAPVKEQLALLVDLRHNLAQRRQELSRLEQQTNQILADQDRLRKNLGAVPAESDLQRRYLAELTAQEDRLAQLRQEIEAKRAEVTAAERAVAEFLKQLTI